MSELTSILSGVVTDRQSFTGDRVKNLRTGKWFTAEVEPIQDIELNAELGRDPREAILLHVQDRAAAAEQNSLDFVTVELPSGPAKLQIIRRSDNPVKLQVEFGCRKVTAQDK